MKLLIIVANVRCITFAALNFLWTHSGNPGFQNSENMRPLLERYSPFLKILNRCSFKIFSISENIQSFKIFLISDDILLQIRKPKHSFPCGTKVQKLQRKERYFKHCFPQNLSSTSLKKFCKNFYKGLLLLNTHMSKMKLLLKGCSLKFPIVPTFERRNGHCSAPNTEQISIPQHIL